MDIQYFGKTLPSPSSALKPYRELRRPLSNRIVLRRPLHARLNTPPRLHQTPPLNPHANRETYSGHTSVHERAGIKRNTAELLPSALSLNEARRRPSSYHPSSIYTRPDRQRARIAPLRRSPISSFTIFSTLPMAFEEPFSGILPDWVACRALRIRARPLGASPTSLGPTEPVVAPSRRVVQQLAAPVQHDEEWRVAPRRHGRRRCRIVPRHLWLRWLRLPCMWVRLPYLRPRLPCLR